MTPRRSSLNILYAGTLPPHPDGSAIVGAQLLAGLARSGHAVRALAAITTPALRAGDRFAKAHPEIGVARFVVPFFDVASAVDTPDDYRSYQCAQIRARLPGLVDEHRPDVIIIGKASFALDVPDLARARSVRSVLLIHGTTEHGILSTPEHPVAQRLVDQYRKVDLAVLVAGHLAGHAQRLGLRDFVVIPNGVDLQRFSPRPKDAALLRHLSLGDDQIVVVHASKLSEVKRPLDIVSSAERVLRQNPAIVYVILGDGPCRAAMQESCRENGVLEHFRFVGWVEHERVPAYLNLADIVVMPSESEALALVYLEAQACGRLLLASNIPAAREVVQDGETGLLFRKGDVDDLAAQTLGAAEDADLRAAIGKKAREWVRTHDLDRTVAAYACTLRDVVNRSPR
jgi:glycosyltransferase involved in cell wall biosynthesis